jgi:hypothetical protein
MPSLAEEIPTPHDLSSVYSMLDKVRWEQGGLRHDVRCASFSTEPADPAYHLMSASFRR